LVVAVPDDDNIDNNDISAVTTGVTDDETFHWCRLLATEAGVMVGANAGMAVAAAARVAAGMEAPGTILTVLTSLENIFSRR